MENILNKFKLYLKTKWNKDRVIYIPEHFYKKIIEYIKITNWVS